MPGQDIGGPWWFLFSLSRWAYWHLLTDTVAAYLAFGLFRYLDTSVPEGVQEVWNARILDAALRTHGKLVGYNSPVTMTHDTRRDGGWSWLSIDVYDPTMRELAKRVSMVVVSVGYRQSPEHAHPVPFEDCLTAVLNNAVKLNLDPTRVAISGDSAGGHLTAAVGLRLKKMKIQVSIYPCLQLLDLQTPSYIENRMYIPGMLNDVSMLSYWLNYGNISYDHMDDILANRHTSSAVKKSKYAERISPKYYMKEHIRTESLKSPSKPTDFGNENLFSTIEGTVLDPYFAPLMADNAEYRGLPLTYVLTAGYDVLRDDGLIYAQRLKEAGVDVHLAHYKEGFHGMIFFFDGPIPFEVGKRALVDLVVFLKKHL
ncbi:neutral cholesterol ester hydrolase 1-like [Haliotis rubra]|uniref:neutral cholesterol ester hydrolase 1-like n=1 Tax=Haliotis rubra TaxID=36100 RepID=UPI001EE53FB2|nr:neutral cholesterol ester hydrolase 1-like [Haliotis rubra]